MESGAALAQSSGGGGNVFKVSQFKESFRALLEDDLVYDEFLEKAPSDISTGDIQMMTKFEQIELEIKRKLTGKEETSESREQFLALEKNAKEHLVSLQEGQSELYKTRKRDINYLTNNIMLENPPPPYEPIAANELILSVAFHHSSKGTKTQEYLVLGRQHLSTLMTKFYYL
eukprot:TRINITY_DN7675_c0_g1_i1.p1 TRINITY_DN7675_c0_g1~~TRINITY_DN7675_c0_g1_i1.p1  ORF type:complete len:173 (+),score=52.14 TRINITY_DN7675_c0_g1_i1:112-630(+)